MYHRKRRPPLTARMVDELPHDTDRVCDTHKVIIMELFRVFKGFFVVFPVCISSLNLLFTAAADLWFCEPFIIMRCWCGRILTPLSWFLTKYLSAAGCFCPLPEIFWLRNRSVIKSAFQSCSLWFSFRL